MKKENKKIIGIDPGHQGAIVFFDGSTLEFFKMPLIVEGKKKEVDFNEVRKVLKKYPDVHILLERAYGGQMGSTGAFNYGRDFAKLEIAIMSCKNPVTYIEPSKWTKKMHEGISADLKPKVKSVRAIQRLLPKIVNKVPKNKNGKMHEGVLDGLLIAEYGRKYL